VGRPQREVDPFRDELLASRQALGGRIRDLRTVRGWSQEEFAAKAHVHRTFAGSLERGEKNCSFHALVLIARCFGITLSEMFAGLEAGESLKSNTGEERRRRSVRGDHDEMDRKRLLQEVMALERTSRTLKEIALGQKESQQSPSHKTKATKAETGFKTLNSALTQASE
jgi:transcriptional regulator with XRE-family HTH domain